jgi:hypothetical protein
VTLGAHPQVLRETSNQGYQPLVNTISAPDSAVENAARYLQQFSASRPPSQPAAAPEATQAQPAGADEEAVVYSQTRMLQDPTGRLR